MTVITQEVTTLLSSNIVENETLWSASIVYNFKDIVRWGHYLYAYNGISGTNSTDNPIVSVDYWTEYAPTNYYAMIDTKRTTQSINNDLIEVTFDCVGYNGIGFDNVSCDTIEVEIYNKTTSAIYESYTFTMIDYGNINNIYDFYHFAPNIKLSLYKGLNLYSNSAIRVRFIRTGGVVSVGLMIAGQLQKIGDTLYNFNLSTIRIDDFVGGLVAKQSYDVLVVNSNIQYFTRLAIQYDKQIMMFIMDESDDTEFENLLVWATWIDFSINIAQPKKSTMNVTIQGVR